jgi:hypothetical protein
MVISGSFELCVEPTILWKANITRLKFLMIEILKVLLKNINIKYMPCLGQGKNRIPSIGSA